MFTELFQRVDLRENLLSTLVLLLAMYMLRQLTIRSVNKSRTIPSEQRRTWIVRVRTLSLFIFVLGLVIIWASELQNFAVSLVAVAAAIVIAFKELIMNFSGYFSRASAKPFIIGDRIEVGGIRGDVIDQNLFFTRILEIGPGHATNQYTGRSVNIPNSTFLSQYIINESFIGSYTLHVFRIPLKVNAQAVEMQRKLLEISQRVCEPYIEQARSAFESFGQAQGLEAPSVEPRVYINFKDKDTMEYVVRIPALTNRKGRIEQDILSLFTETVVLSFEKG